MLKGLFTKASLITVTILLGSTMAVGTALAYTSPSNYYSPWNQYLRGPVVSQPNSNPTNNQNGQITPPNGDTSATTTGNTDSNTGSVTPSQPTTGPTANSDFYSRFYNRYPWGRNSGSTQPTTPAPGDNSGGTPQQPGENPSAPTTPTTPPANQTPGGNVGTSTPATGDNSNTNSDVSFMNPEEQQMFNKVNQERVNAGLPPYKADPTLTRLARMKSQDMYNNNYFDHNSPTYGSALDMERNAGYSARVMGAENIAKAASVDRAHELLMNSSGHRANILDSRHDTIGIGVVDTPNGVYVTQLFSGN